MDTFMYRAARLITIGVLTMTQFCACSFKSPYEKYISKDAEIGVAMDYPSGWTFRESRGARNSYAQVDFYVPKKEKNQQRFIAVTVKDTAQLGLPSASIESLTEDILSKRQKFKEYALISKTATVIGNATAWDITIAYKMMDKLYSVDAKLIPVKERFAVFSQKGKFYIARYQNTSQEFDAYAEVFSHCLKSITILPAGK
jgi:hypothetical protein